MSFETKRNKISILSEQNISEKDRIKVLPLNNYQKSDIIFLKKSSEIVLLDGVYFDYNDWKYAVYQADYKFTNIDSSYLPHIHPKFYITSDSGTDFELESFLYAGSYTYLWKKSGNDYIFKFRFDGQISQTTLRATYLHLSLVVLNQRVWNEISNSKT